MLTDEKRMQPAGLKAFEAKRENRSGIYVYEQRPQEFDEPYLGLMKKNKAAWTYFQAQLPSYRRTLIWFVVSAKQEETRLKRLKRLIERALAGGGWLDCDISWSRTADQARSGTGERVQRSYQRLASRDVLATEVVRANRSRSSSGDEIMRIVGVVVFAGLTVAIGGSAMLAQNRLPPDAPRPIDAGESLWAEELTSMEVRDALRAGTTTIIVGTGGVEQNGPYVAGGKHNYVLQTVLPDIARAIGKALIAPIVKFVPEGSIEPVASGHMAVRRHDRCRRGHVRGAADRHLPQLQGARLPRHHSARRQRRQPAGMEKVAEALNRKWSAERARVHYLGSTTTRISGATTT